VRPDGEALQRAYLELVRRYTGHDQGSATFRLYGDEWSFVPHFYYILRVPVRDQPDRIDRALQGHPRRTRPAGTAARDRTLALLSAGARTPGNLLAKPAWTLRPRRLFGRPCRRMNAVMTQIEAICRPPRSSHRATLGAATRAADAPLAGNPLAEARPCRTRTRGSRIPLKQLAWSGRCLPDRAGSARRVHHGHDLGQILRLTHKSMRTAQAWPCPWQDPGGQNGRNVR